MSALGFKARVWAEVLGCKLGNIDPSQVEQIYVNTFLCTSHCTETNVGGKLDIYKYQQTRKLILILDRHWSSLKTSIPVNPLSKIHIK